MARESEIDREMWEEEAMERQRQRPKWCGHKSVKARNHQKLEDAGKDSLLAPLEGGVGGHHQQLHSGLQCC